MAVADAKGDESPTTKATAAAMEDDVSIISVSAEPKEDDETMAKASAEVKQDDAQSCHSADKVSRETLVRHHYDMSALRGKVKEAAKPKKQKRARSHGMCLVGGVEAEEQSRRLRKAMADYKYRHRPF